MRAPIAAVVLLALAACTTPTTSAPTQGARADPLADVGRWTLQGATDASGARIDSAVPGGDAVHVLVFGPGNALSLEGGCNRIGGEYGMDAAGRLVVGPLRMTRMACADTALMEADTAVSSLVQGSAEWRIAESWPEQLFLDHADGRRSHWVAVR